MCLKIQNARRKQHDVSFWPVQLTRTRCYFKRSNKKKKQSMQSAKPRLFYLRRGHVCRDPWLESFQQTSNNPNVSKKLSGTPWIVWLGYFHTLTMSHRRTTSQLQHLPRLLTIPHTTQTSLAQDQLDPRQGQPWTGAPRRRSRVTVAVCISSRPCVLLISHAGGQSSHTCSDKLW